MNVKEMLVQASKKAYEEKLFAATSGNLSVYDRETKRMYITPGSYPYELMTADDIMVIDLDGNILEGDRRPSSEWRMHAIVYREMPTVNAIVHTHSPYATAFAINRLAIPPILYELVYFIGADIPVSKPAVPGTPEVGIYAVEAIQGRSACLLGNHGVLAIGDTLQNAYTRAVYVEDAAKAYSLALGHGPVHVLDEEDVKKMLHK